MGVTPGPSCCELTTNLPCCPTGPPLISISTFATFLFGNKSTVFGPLCWSVAGRDDPKSTPLQQQQQQQNEISFGQQWIIQRRSASRTRKEQNFVVRLTFTLAQDAVYFGIRKAACAVRSLFKAAAAKKHGWWGFSDLFFQHTELKKAQFTSVAFVRQQKSTGQHKTERLSWNVLGELDSFHACFY